MHGAVSLLVRERRLEVLMKMARRLMPKLDMQSNPSFPSKGLKVEMGTVAGIPQLVKLTEKGVQFCDDNFENLI